MFKYFILSIFIPVILLGQTICIISDSIGSDHVFPSFPVILAELNPELRVINNFKGSTFVESAYSRLQVILETEIPDILVITLGINDALSGRFSADKIYNDFAKVIELSHSNGIPVVIGKIDFNMYHLTLNNSLYEENLMNIYKRLEDNYNITLFPFLHRLFIVDLTNTSDGFHPTRKGQRIIAENLNKHLNEVFFGQPKKNQALIL